MTIDIPQPQPVIAALDEARAIASGEYSGAAAVARRLHEVKIATRQIADSVREARLQVRLCENAAERRAQAAVRKAERKLAEDEAAHRREILVELARAKRSESLLREGRALGLPVDNTVAPPTRSKAKTS